MKESDQEPLAHQAKNRENDDSNKLTAIARCKFIFVLIIALSAIAFIAIYILTMGQYVKNPDKKEITGNYSIYISAEDYGCGVNKAILSLNKVLDKVEKSFFIVNETKTIPNMTDPERTEYQQTTGRTIEKVYLCDEKGNQVEEASKFLAFELKISPTEGSPFIYNGYNYWVKDYELIFKTAGDVKLLSEGEKMNAFNIEKKYTQKFSPADKFKFDKKKYGKYNYNIATYEPKEKSQNLFVWLNGAGEGGSDTLGEKTGADVTILANKVTALAGNKFQRRTGGMNVLVPQAPTMWMDDGEGNLGAGNRESIYIESLIELIDEYVKKNDIKNVFIGGCSNGGYMTMNIAMDYKDKYQGYVPICEAMLDERISDEDIEALKDLPIYFVYSLDDTAVTPSKFEEPTIKRLKEAGAKDLHVSTTYHVKDTSGKYFDNRGKPYQYHGHFSWIYFFNGETSCDDCEISAFEWMGKLIKNKEE